MAPVFSAEVNTEDEIDMNDLDACIEDFLSNKKQSHTLNVKRNEF